jgi:hypothetical protein
MRMSEAGRPASSNEPFVPRSDRPELKPDTRVGELTVRELLGVLEASSTTLKPAAAEFKYFKHEFWKYEHLKIELWKVEHPEIPIPQFPPGPDPRFAEIAQGIAGLREQVAKLASEVADLRRQR